MRFLIRISGDDITHFKKNDQPPVPEIQGKAKSGHIKAKKEEVKE